MPIDLAPLLPPDRSESDYGIYIYENFPLTALSDVGLVTGRTCSVSPSDGGPDDDEGRRTEIETSGGDRR